jgi:anaerobic selenocysteine-containing dehydrogenase
MASDRALTTPTLSRREFLGTSALATGLVLGLDRLAWSAPPAAARAPAALYRDWRDVYRQGWRWDRVARGTHTCANCVAACAWNLYVRDGLVWREEQAAPYRASNASVPDWNPRGCQKGASYSDLALSPSRVSHPLRRVGPRGAGRWRRISWDEALSEIGATLVDVLERRGGEGVVCQFGGHIAASVSSGSSVPRSSTPLPRSATCPWAGPSPWACRSRTGAPTTGSVPTTW